MISSPCRNCRNKDVPKDKCAKDCRLLIEVQQLHASVEESRLVYAIDVLEEYAITIDTDDFKDISF